MTTENILSGLEKKSLIDRLIFMILIGAGNEIRTRDPDLGKVVLYQLSYSRVIQ